MPMPAPRSCRISNSSVRADMQKARVSGLVIGVVDVLFRTPAILGQ